VNATLGTVVLALSLLAPAAAGQNEYISLKTPPQTDAPLQIAGAIFNDTSLQVLLVNVSGRSVDQVTMGVVLGDGAAAVPPVTRVGTACSATVPPDGFLVVNQAHVGFDKGPAYFREKGIAKKETTVGVTHVRFTDGTEWTYLLEAKGRFEEKPDQTVTDRVHALVEKHFPGKDMSWAFPRPGETGKAIACRR
jgi:hypothetical protein